MKDLQQEQRRMRERIQAARTKKAAVDRSRSPKTPETEDVQALLRRIEVLEAENASLRRQLSALRDQPRAQEHSRTMSDSERRHLFMKYINVRRY